MTEEPESWPGFRPHPDDAAFCYVCGQVRGNHGDAPDVHCPPAVLRRTRPVSATSKHYDEKIERLRELAHEIRDVAVDHGGSVMLARGAELLDLADELAVVVKAYPHPGIADQAFALCTEEVVSLLYDRGRREELTADGWRFLLMYAIADRMKGAQTGTLISAALLALGGLGKAEIPGKER